MSWKSCKEYMLVDLWGLSPDCKNPDEDINAVNMNGHLEQARKTQQEWTDY
jgi:hypothetical protein